MNQICTSAAILAVLVGCGFCQIGNDIDVDDLEKQLKDNFNASNVDRLLKEKCIKNGGGEEAFNALKNQQAELQACLESQVNATEIQKELEEAKKTGSMDEVFGKYCKKYPEIYACAEKSIDKVRPCLEARENETLNKGLKILGELKEFVCFKDGDRIAMFIAEGGVECLESRKEQLQECANKTIGQRIPTDFSLETLPLLVFTDRECNDFDRIRSCFNTELEKCKDSTPANIVDAFFKFLKKHMPCGDPATSQAAVLGDGKSETGSSSAGLVASSLVLGASILVSKYL